MVPSTKTSFEGVRVLFLEDEALVAMNHVEMLESLGCSVTVCSRLAEALAAIGREPPDVALLDVNIDGETSYGVAEALERMGVPSAFLTGYTSPSLEARWRDYPHCEKPCDMDDLRRLLSRCLG